MTNHLYSDLNNTFGMDIFSLDIQRSRDHGIPSYKEFRKFCRLKEITSIDELRETLIDGVSLSTFKIL